MTSRTQARTATRYSQGATGATSCRAGSVTKAEGPFTLSDAPQPRGAGCGARTGFLREV